MTARTPPPVVELHGLKQRRYTGLTDIIAATNRSRRTPTERSAFGSAQSQRRDLT